MDVLGNQVFNFLDIGYTNEASNIVCEFLKAAAEDLGKDLAPDKETCTYYTFQLLYGYALWVEKPENKKLKEQLIDIVDKGVEQYLKTGHPERMKLIEDMSKGQTKLKEIVKKQFPNAIDEYEIQGQRIDIYLPDEKLGIEYDGAQHYKFCPVFHKTESDFKRQQWLDKEKERKCKEVGITLIRIRFDEEISWKTIMSKVMATKDG
jgi:very-short-patch-repair endonuclease